MAYFLVISLAFWAWHQRPSLRGQIVLVASFSAAALCNPILWGALFMVMLVFNKKTEEYNDVSSLNKQKTFFDRNPFWIAVSFSFCLS